MARTWLITGCARGLGAYITSAALDAGDNVVATARNVDGLRLERYGERVRIAPLDVTDFAAAERAVALAVEAFGGLDVVVNNAGYATLGAFEDMPSDEFRRQVETNFFGAVNVCRAALPTLRAQRRGNIVQISSIGGRMGTAGLAAYQSSKWALEGFSEALAAEVRALGIHVTIVEPGSFRTDFSAMAMHPPSTDYESLLYDFQSTRAHRYAKRGDPERAASTILRMLEAENPPLRLLLGSDAVEIAQEVHDRQQAEDERWRDLSKWTDFPTPATFLEIAESRRITTAAAPLALLDWEVDPDGYQRMKLPNSVDLDGILRLMWRRALEPRLVSEVLRLYPARPLERALIAYDVLRTSLLGTLDDALVAQLARELAPLKSIANASVAVPLDRIAALVDAVPPADGLEPPCLGADVDVLAHAEMLAASHLPSLAIAFLQIVWHRSALPRALELIAELALDHDLLDSVPVMADTDERSMELKAYVVARASLANWSSGGAAQVLEHPAIRESTNPWLVLVRGHARAMKDEELSFDDISAIQDISSAAPGWRYAQAVSDAVSAKAMPEMVAPRLEDYCTRRGNDPWVWGQAAMTDSAKDAIAKILARELRYTSHDPAAWRALSLISGESSIDDEVQARLTAQLAAAL